MEVKRQQYTPLDVGPSPSEWPAPLLGEISTLITNGFVGTATKHYTDSTGVPYLYGSNVRINSIDTKGIRYITNDFHSEQSKTELKEGDLLTVQSGHIGVTATVPKEFEGANCHALIVTRLKRNLADPQFVSYYLNSHIGKARLRGLEVGSTILHINTKDLKKFRILLPSLPEQQRITEILSTWDKSIATTERLLFNAEKQKKALMQQLLTGKKRLPGFAGEWKPRELGELFERVTKRNTEGDTTVVTISAQQGLIRQEEFFKKSVASATLENYFLLERGQFAYNKSYSNGYPMGAIKRLYRYPKAVVTSLYICFDVKDPEICSPDFFEHWFEAGMLNRGLTKVANEGGRAHGLLNVKPSDFFGLKVLTPSIDEQLAIAEVLNQATREIELFRSRLNFLIKEKKALMQQLLTGKRRVKVPANNRKEASYG